MFDLAKCAIIKQKTNELHRLRSERKKLRAIYNTIFKKPEPFVLVYIFDFLSLVGQTPEEKSNVF